MPQKPLSFPDPPWTTIRIENEAIERHRGVGAFVPAEEREPLVVGIVQRDDLSPDGDPAAIQRNPAQVRLTGVRLSPDEARELARLLERAARMITATSAARSGPARPARGWNGGYGLAPVTSAPPVQPQRRSA